MYGYQAQPSLAGLSSTSPRRKRKSPLSKWLFLFAVFVFFGLCGYLGLLWVSNSLLSQGGVEVHVSPSVLELQPGQQATVTLSLLNTGLRREQLRSLIMPASWSQGVLVRDSTPPFLRIESLPDGQALIYPNLDIPAGKAVEIRLQMEALKSGTYQGTWRVRLDSGQEATFLLTAVVQTAQQAASPPTPPPGEEQPTFQPAVQPAETQGTLTALVERLARSVVMIVAVRRQGQQWMPLWTGSGTVIDPRGYILTNAHVALTRQNTPPDDLLILITQNTDEPPVPAYRARVVLADPKLDLAVLRIDRNLEGRPLSSPPDLPAVPLGDSDTLRLGAPLLILGYPGIGGDTITFTRGEVSGFVAQQGYGSRAWIKTSATIAGGSSGGLAANLKGEIVGIPTRVGTESGEVVDCRYLVDTNGDGVVDRRDTCVPIGGFLNSLRPINLAKPLIQAALQGKQVGLPTPESGQPGLSLEPVFQETFDNPATGYWRATKDEEGATFYRKDAYWVKVYKPQWVLWFVYHEQELQDMVVRARFRVVWPTGEGDVGLVCRGNDRGDFYAFSLSEDGYYAIWMQYQEQMKTLIPWRPLPEPVLVPQRWVTLTAACVGPQLMFWLEDTLLARVHTSTLRQGYGGFAVGTLNQPNLLIAVDDFALFRVQK